MTRGAADPDKIPAGSPTPTRWTKSWPPRPAPSREADNGGDFIAEVERQTGIRVRVISGTEEARLIHLAAVYGVNVGGDAGGRHRHRRRQRRDHARDGARISRQAQSFKLGVIRLTERFVRSDPLSDHDERRLVKHINRDVGAYLDEIAGRGFERVIGTSGTILSLGALALSEERASRRTSSATCASRPRRSAAFASV